MSRRFLIVVLVLASLGAAPPALAQTSRCTFGGSAPGFKAVRLDLPSGSSFLNTEITGSRTPKALNLGPDSWHLAQGIVVVREDEGGRASIVSYRLRSEGSSPTGATVRWDGSEVAAAPESAGADVPFTHSRALSVSSLPPGGYYAIAWGAGGSGAAGSRDAWGAAVEVEGVHSCQAVGTGVSFDLEQNDFAGGTQETAPGVAVMQNTALERAWTDRGIVVGMIDAAVQGAGTGEAAVAYETPWETGPAERAVRPFIGGPGRYRFEAMVTGLFPVVSITGIRIDLP